ncbi:MAG TPA: UDP-N-acetylmuramoyl-L-alanyl-D-glutamate--2,6-diaminopimelate ligase [Terriglobales bacterium]|nr:UDP-N-acetylmuramoyl-L-alanyl-D-glutamate--2,6-diaminopimelate ligase [Terriglobales bacterium]
MTFEQLLDGAEILAQRGNPSVRGLDYDSRRIQPGDVFVAMRGEAQDGNRFIDQAIAAGAVAIVTDSGQERPRAEVAWAQAAHGRRVLARLSANFYRRPAERLAMTGITGTNGKTTTAFLVESMLRAAGRKAALIGTIEYHVAGEILPAPHTTPEALELHRMLNQALGHGATEGVMEVSSHALAQQRVYGIPFDVAVFTNLTPDHLDYHHTMEEYFASKRILFEGCGTDGPRVAVVNIDGEYGGRLVKVSKQHGAEVLTYGLRKADLHAEKVEIGQRGSRFDLVTPEAVIPLFSPLLGQVNVYNILAAAGAGYARGLSAERIACGVDTLTRVPGRFEQVDRGQPFTLVVDYAHTPDALRNLTSLARKFVEQADHRGRVITVFGCGGNRDRGKRPLMGEAAGESSDFVVLTSDNPRQEDPRVIINDALVGLQRSDAKYKVEPDRKAAIALAIGEARPGDIVLLAGKGHERFQIVGREAIPFDDVEVARELLRRAGFCPQPAGANAARNL